MSYCVCVCVRVHLCAYVWVTLFSLRQGHHWVPTSLSFSTSFIHLPVHLSRCICWLHTRVCLSIPTLFSSLAPPASQIPHPGSVPLLRHLPPTPTGRVRRVLLCMTPHVLLQPRLILSPSCHRLWALRSYQRGLAPAPSWFLPSSH